MANAYRKTSGEFLIGVMEERQQSDEKLKLRYQIAADVYIKQWSFAVLNRVCLGFALILSLFVLVWPVFGAKISAMTGAADPSVLQTAITTAAAAAIYGYQYYKRRQAATENLLRTIAFGEQDDREVARAVIAEIGKIDTGFGFQTRHETEERPESEKTE